MMEPADYAETSVNREHGVRYQKNLIFEILLKFETFASIRSCARILVTFDIWQWKCSLTVHSKNRHFRYTGLCTHFCAVR
jgi:hypothetical protein